MDTFDGRSDDKGAEPEGLAMAEIDGRLVGAHGITPTLSACPPGDDVLSNICPVFLCCAKKLRMGGVVQNRLECVHVGRALGLCGRPQA